jgi:preprotein translocase subunit SecY
MWLVTSAVRKVPIRFPDSDATGEMCLRASWVGRGPLTLAGMAFVPFTLACIATGTYSSGPGLAARLVFPGTWLHSILYAAAVVPAAYMYVWIVFKPKGITGLMDRYGCEIESVPPAETAGHLTRMVGSMTFVAMLLLVLLSLARQIHVISMRTSLPGSFSWPDRPLMVFRYFSMWQFLVLVGVAYDVKCQYRARLRMAAESGGSPWRVAYTAFDEIEAEIKCGYLASKGVTCVVEPLRFTWGLPIRTAADRYRLQVPEGEHLKAMGLLMDAEQTSPGGRG